MHLKEYDIKDSNVELIGSDLDHKVKYNSAASEPAWNNGSIGQEPGLHVWRIENFEVIPWAKKKYGEFHEGDSYIVLSSVKIGKDENEKLVHDVYFWIGSHSSQDEAGTAAYKTVELDEFLHGAAVQHRELQAQMSDDFLALFPRFSILRGGVASGFTHVEQDPEPKGVTTLLRIFKHPTARKADAIVVVEVEPTISSLDEEDVFVLDKGDKIWVWQGKKASPMEKAKAAQVVHDLTLAKHIDVEVVAQTDARARIITDSLGGENIDITTQLKAKRPVHSADATRSKKLLRLSDASGELSLDAVKDGQGVSLSDLDSNDVFLYDTGKVVWVWEGGGASRQEKAMWIKVAQSYVRCLQSEAETDDNYLIPVAKVNEGNESPAFLRAFD